MKRPLLLNIGKFAFIVLIIILVGYVAFEKPVLKSQNQFLKEEINLTSVYTDKTLQDSIVAYGFELLGTPYVTSGSGKEGFDCSGFVYFVFQHFNIYVPRSTAGYENFGKEISIENVEKGDLLLFLSPTRNAIGHIGIITYANGSESDFIHASSGSKMKVIVTNLSNEGYTRRFVKAIRAL